jgi:hypothetical protein
VDLISGPRGDAVAPAVPSGAPQHQQGPSGEPQILLPLSSFALSDISNTAISITVKVRVRVRATVTIVTPFLSLSPLLLLQCHDDAASEVQDEDLGAEAALSVFEEIIEMHSRYRKERKKKRGIEVEG